MPWKAKKPERVMWYPQYSAACDELKTPTLFAASVSVCTMVCSLPASKPGVLLVSDAWNMAAHNNLNRRAAATTTYKKDVNHHLLGRGVESSEMVSGTWNSLQNSTLQCCLKFWLSSRPGLSVASAAAALACTTGVKLTTATQRDSEKHPDRTADAHPAAGRNVHFDRVNNTPEKPCCLSIRSRSRLQCGQLCSGRGLVRCTPACPPWGHGHGHCLATGQQPLCMPPQGFGDARHEVPGHTSLLWLAITLPMPSTIAIVGNPLPQHHITYDLPMQCTDDRDITNMLHHRSGFCRIADCPHV